MQQIQTLKKEKNRKKKEKQAQKRAEYAKKLAKEESITREKEKERRKDFFKVQGLAEKRSAGSWKSNGTRNKKIRTE